jgi:hypothetical protein
MGKIRNWRHGDMAISALIEWVKRNPISSLIGSAGTIVGFVAGVPPAWQAASQMLRIPECATYSNVYYYYDGHFRNDGREWIEYQPKEQHTFKEMYRNRNYITLINQTPRKDPRWQSMLVRLPVCGGSAQWTYQNPEHWNDLYNVTRKVAPEEAEKQARLE